MARTKRILIRFCGPLALVLSLPLNAVEPLRATELVQACQSYTQGGRVPTCAAYIQGYLSASNDIVSVEDRPSPFVARAMRTRTSRLSEAAEQRLDSRYCLPEGETLDDVIAKVAAESADLSETAGAALVMRRVFEKHYLCDAVMSR